MEVRCGQCDALVAAGYHLRGGLCNECVAMSLARDVIAKAEDTSRMRVLAEKPVPEEGR